MTIIQIIWTIIFIIAILLFLVVELVVVVGGARDLVAMMKVLVQARGNEKEN